MNMTPRYAVLLCVLVLPACQAPAPRTDTTETPSGFTRTEDVIYGRKYGSARTMDVYTPTEKHNISVGFALVNYPYTVYLYVH